MGGKKIPIYREAKLQGALATLAPSAGIEYPLTGLADQQAWVEPGYIAQSRVGRHVRRSRQSSEGNERRPKASHSDPNSPRAVAGQVPATAEVQATPWFLNQASIFSQPSLACSAR